METGGEGRLRRSSHGSDRCGCGVKETLLSGRKSEREYGKAETMVIVTTERLRYEELYTDKIWDVAVDESGTTFEETLVNQIHDFLKELKTMSAWPTRRTSHSREKSGSL